MTAAERTKHAAAVLAMLESQIEKPDERAGILMVALTAMSPSYWFNDSHKPEG